jgi:hypothetical protein
MKPTSSRAAKTKAGFLAHLKLTSSMNCALRCLSARCAATGGRNASYSPSLCRRVFATELPAMRCRPQEAAPDDIREFLSSRSAAGGSKSYASQLAIGLSYGATCGDQIGKLTAVIPNPVHWKLLASLPHALTPRATGVGPTAVVQITVFGKTGSRDETVIRYRKTISNARGNSDIKQYARLANR